MVTPRFWPMETLNICPTVDTRSMSSRMMPAAHRSTDSQFVWKGCWWLRVMCLAGPTLSHTCGGGGGGGVAGVGRWRGAAGTRRTIGLLLGGGGCETYRGDGLREGGGGGFGTPPEKSIKNLVCSSFFVRATAVGFRAKKTDCMTPPLF